MNHSNLYRLLLALGLLFFSAIDRASASAVVLMYHHFGDERYHSTNIRLEQFDAQLDYLQRAGFQVWPLTQIVDHLQQQRPIPDKTIAITMDDAYRSVYSEAYPRLKKRGWPFTVFVSSDYIDKGYSNYMTWAQMREMSAHGADFGNHSAGHSHLVRRHQNETADQWQQRIRRDLQQARDRLAQELPTSRPLLAYPYGEYSLPLTRIVAALGYTAFGQQSGAIGAYSDLKALPRYPIAEAFADPEGFKTKVLSLPLPVVKTTPSDPVTAESRPLLTVELAAVDARLEQLACYASGQGRIEVRWLNKKERRFSVQASRELPPGRSRYNCTAPAAEKGRFYWFSQPWLRPGGSD